MEIQGTIEGKNIEVADMEFAVEIDSGDLWQEIESSVEDCASEAVTNYMEYYEHDVDYTSGASQLLREYNPGTGCSLAREFEEAVQGAVQVNGWLEDIIKAQAATPGTPAEMDTAEIRKLVRSEVRMALAAALTTLTNGEEA